jgi:hypothetical protein
MNDKLTDERLEGLLREFLAADAAASEPPASLRRRVAEAREMAVTAPARRRPFTLAWRPPRALAAAGVAVAVVLVGVLSATLSGLLPLGRADCSGVTIEAVTDAVTDVPGYTWRMTGTELVHRLVDVHGETSDEIFDYRTVDLELAGVYDAPDAWQVEVIGGDEQSGQFPIPPHTGLWFGNDVDSYLVADGQAWVRIRGGEHYQPTDPEDNVQIAREANQLLGLVEQGEPFWITFGSPRLPTITWTVESTTEGCRVIADDPRYADLPGVTWRVEVLVDPETLLPVRGLYEYATAAAQQPLPVPSGALLSDERVHLDFTYDYEATFTIDSPVPVGFESVMEAQARADATAAGLSSPFTTVTFQLAEAQVYAIHTPSGTAVLLYQNGTLASSEVVPANVDVFVDLVLTDDADPKAFLIAVVNDPRVATVEVTFSNGETRQVGGYAVRPSVSSGENLGEIVTWVPLDDEGNEVEVDPPRP